MCDSQEEKAKIEMHCNLMLADAWLIRARNIRFHGHRPSHKREHYAAKTVTHAEAYSARPSTLLRMFHNG